MVCDASYAPKTRADPSRTGNGVCELTNDVLRAAAVTVDGTTNAAPTTTTNANPSKRDRREKAPALIRTIPP
jgi:hypothetical protein